MNAPLFHLDIHGKKDRKHNMEIDIGTRAIREDHVKDDQETFVRPLIRTFTQKLNDVFQGLDIKGHKVVGNPEGELVGKWSDGNMFTMTH